MSLSDTLDAIKVKSQTNPRISPEARGIMRRSIEELRESGILTRVVRPGDRAPEFTLPDSGGRLVRLEDLLARGPAVLSFFRGRW